MILASSPLPGRLALEARPSSWCQRALAQLTSPSFVQNIQSLGSRFKNKVDRHHAETFAELAERRSKIRPLLYGRTLVESSLMFWLIVYGMEGAKLFNAASGHNLFGGNADGLKIRNEILQDPELMVLFVSVYAPMVEELTFRFFPRFFFGKTWKVAIASSLAFGFVHNLQQIPLPQLVSGFYFWSLMKNRGITHAMLGHSVNNAWVVYLILNQ